MMDIDKLIKRLKKASADGSWNTLADYARKAATALSTLQAENAQLRRLLSEAISACSCIAEWAQDTGHDYVEGIMKEFLEVTNDGL